MTAFIKFAIKTTRDMDADTRLKTKEKIIAMLKTVYDPEIQVNIYY